MNHRREHNWNCHSFLENKERCESLAMYLIEHQSTVRDAATYFGLSKSTVHKDVREKLPHINAGLYAQVHALFEKNKSERHLRGGEATRKKYKENQVKKKKAGSA